MRTRIPAIALLLLVLLCCGLAAPALQAQEGGGRPGSAEASPEKEGAALRRPPGRFLPVLERLRKDDPEEYRRLQKLRTENRREYFRRMHALLPPDARRRFSAEVGRREREQRELAAEYHRTQDPRERTELLRRLRLNIAETHQMILDDMKQRIARMQRKISQMERNAGGIQEQRLQKLLRKSTPPPSPPPAEKP